MYPMLSSKIGPNDTVDFMINHTKSNYINLKGINTDKVHNSFERFLYAHNVWSYKDEIEIVQKHKDYKPAGCFNIDYIIDFYDKDSNSTIDNKTYPDYVHIIEVIRKKDTNELKQLLSKNTVSQMSDIECLEILQVLVKNKINYRLLNETYDLLIQQVNNSDLICAFLWNLSLYENQVIYVAMIKNNIMSCDKHFFIYKLHSKRINDIWSLLHLACYYGYMDIVKDLISIGANVNCVSSKGRLPIHYSILKKHDDITKTLLSTRNIDISLETNKQYNLLYFACKTGNLEITKYLVEIMNVLIGTPNKKTGGTSYHAAAYYNKVECLKYLLKTNIQYLYHKNIHGFTILHSSAQNNSLECFKYLIEEIKFDPMTPGPNCKNAFEVAIESKSSDIIKYILDKSVINPYILSKGRLIFDSNTNTEMIQFYNRHHKNLITMKSNYKIKMDDKIDIQFINDYIVCIHNNIRFAHGNSIIKSYEYTSAITVNNYFRLRKNMIVIMNDYIETKIQKNISIPLTSGMKVTLPKGRKVYINDILAILHEDLDVEVII